MESSKGFVYVMLTLAFVAFILDWLSGNPTSTSSTHVVIWSAALAVLEHKEKQ